METYRKNYRVTTKAQAQDLLNAQDDFTDNPIIGQASPALDSHLLKLWNGGSHLTWQWSDESQQEYDQRIAKEAVVKAEQEKLESDNDHFLDVKIRRWRNDRLVEWIDDTYLKPLKYNLSNSQVAERSQIHQKLLDWPGLIEFTTYKTEDEIDDLKLSAPSWIV